MTCPACGVPVPEGARFCPECGQRLVVAPDERRLVTVLMADLVGFTAFSADTDPEQVKRLVDDCFARLVDDVVAFGGHLDKIVGDELIALFGAPVAHEDDAERAVRAGLRMHDTLSGLAPTIRVPLQMRVGINTGEVLVGAMRAGGDPTVMGDVVNTAQRLQKLANPGEVIVGPATYQATRERVEYEHLGPQDLKGKDAPVDAYRARSAASRPGRRAPRQRAPLIGRDIELNALRQVIELATARRRAQLITLTGDAGVGKSRLAHELALIAVKEHGAELLVGHCVPYGDANPYGPIAEALRGACGLDIEVASPEARPRVAEVVTRVLHLTPENPEIDRVSEGLLYLMDGVARPGVDPGRARDDALRSVVSFLEGVTEAQPVALMLSDLQWAEPEAIELIDRLLTRLHHSPITVVATSRVGFEPMNAAEPGRYNALTLNLEPLDSGATAELVRALMRGDADEETVAFLLERSGGNPFFVEELVAFVQETRDGDGLHELPATLHGLVAARLDTLDALDRSVLEDCAVIGSQGSIAEVLALASRVDARSALERLAERDLVTVDRDEFHFKSELIREIAYGTLTKAERARRHATVAPALVAKGDGGIDQLAHHLATAAELVAEIGVVPGVPDDVRDQAIDALERAAARDDAIESWVLSERHHDRALRLIGEEPGEARRRALLGRARARVQQHMIDPSRHDALTALSEARIADDHQSIAQALTILGEGEVASGAHDVAVATFADALDEWRALGDDSGAANVLRGLGMSHLFRGQLEEADRFVSEALGTYRALGNQRGSAWALQNLAWIAFSQGHIAQAEKRLEESADLFGELGDWGGLGWAYGLLAFVRFSQGRIEEAAAIAEHIAVEGRETGNRWATAMMSVLLANAALWSGHTAECVERGAEAIAGFRAIGDRWGGVMAMGSVVRALAELGRDDEYRAKLDEYREIAEQAPDESMRTFPDVIAACVELQRGNPSEAWELLRTLTPEESAGLGQADSDAAHGLALLQLGRTDESVELLEAAYAAQTDDGPAMAIGSRLALALAAAHRADDALRLTDELQMRAGGTYSDRMFALWGESLARAQTGHGDARAGVDAAHAIATATDAPLEHAIAALARTHVLTAIGDPESVDVARDARRQLDALGLDARGWSNVFDSALVGAAPSR